MPGTLARSESGHLVAVAVLVVFAATLFVVLAFDFFVVFAVAFFIVLFVGFFVIRSLPSVQYLKASLDIPWNWIHGKADLLGGVSRVGRV